MTRALDFKLASAHSRWEIWSRWTLATTLGELFGFGVPALIMPLALALGLPESAIPLPAIIAGAGEGAVVGLAQWFVLHRYLPMVSQRAWVLATMSGAMLAYALAMIPTSLVDPGTLPLAVLIGGGAVLGILFVLTMGGAQWLVLRAHLRHAHWWIWANAVAWPLGVMMPMLGLTAIPDSSPMFVVVLTGIVTGVLMGAVVGGLTGAALLYLLRRNIGI